MEARRVRGRPSVAYEILNDHEQTVSESIKQFLPTDISSHVFGAAVRLGALCMLVGQVIDGSACIHTVAVPFLSRCPQSQERSKFAMLLHIGVSFTRSSGLQAT
jgi:hypothetical protein